MNRANISKILLLLIFWSIFSACEEETIPKPEIINAEKWQYTGFDNKWRRAYLPECIQYSLQRDTIIGGIFYRAEFLNDKWTDTVAWTYKGILNIDQLDKKSSYELNISRLIGVADVYLNDSLLFTAENAFISYKIDVTKLIHKGANTVVLKFKSFDKLKKQFAKQADFTLPYKGLEFFRLPYYYFDTLNGLALLPTGIKKQVYLLKWNKIRFKNIHFQLIDLQKDKLATIKATYIIESADRDEFSLLIAYKKKNLYHQKIQLEKGLNTIEATFTIRNPKLWFTHDLGEPFLYKIKSSIFKNKNLWAYTENYYGIKKITIDTTDNAFNLYLNDVPLTLKILDFTANDILYGIKSVPDQMADYFVKMNANMIHIYDKGEYPNDKFYTDCDKLGILIWQDFMLPYKILPQSPKLENNIRDEAEQQVIRLRNHASIAFWSGNNNIEKLLKKYSYSTEDSLKIIKNNTLIFSNILPQTINKLDSGRYYFSDMNFFSIAHSQSDIPAYPFIVTLRRLTKSRDKKPHSKVIVNLSRPSNADSIIRKYMRQTIKVPQDITSYLYFSQYIAKKYYEQEIVKQRFQNRYTAFDYSNIKDYSPAFSASAIDYYGYWKGKAYAIKNAFKNIIFNIEEQNGWIYIYINSDFQENTPADFYFILYNFDGKVLWRKNYLNITIDKMSDRKYFSFNLSSELNRWGKNFCVFKINMYIDKELYAEKYFLFVSDKNLKLKKPNIKRNYYKVEDGYVVELTTDYFAHGVYLYTDRDGLLDDNYFDIIPGETKKIKFFTQNDIFAIEGAFKTIDLTDIDDGNLFRLNNK